MYTLIPTPQFRRAYRKLDSRIQHQVDKALGLLSENPRHASLHAHKRRGEDEIGQARVTRSYRLYLRMAADTITLLHVGPHEK